MNIRCLPLFNQSRGQPGCLQIPREHGEPLRSPHKELRGTDMLRLDPEILWHGRGAAALVVRICRELGVAPASTCVIAESAISHDIGKHFVPQDILDSPNALTPRQTALMRQHTRCGADLLERTGAMSSSDPSCVDEFVSIESSLPL